MRCAWRWLSCCVLFSAMGCANPGAPDPAPSPGPTTIQKITADALVVPPGSTAGAPAVRLAREQVPVGGAMVTCTVTGGGGQIASGTAISGADGVASCGTWTVGASRGLNTLTVATAGLPPALFAAMGGATSPDVTVAVEAPAAGGLVGDAFDLRLSLGSTYQVESVQAQVGETEAALVRQDPSHWGTTVTVPDRPSGELAIVATATDHYGTSSDAVRVVRLDRPPRITVRAPTDGVLSRGTVSVEVECEDAEGPCTRAEVLTTRARLAGGAPPLAVTLDLSQWDGQAVDLHLNVYDSADQLAGAVRTVYLESSPRLASRRTVSGNVLDASADRTLFIDPDSLVQLGTTVSASISLQDAAGAVTTSPFSVNETYVSGSSWCRADLSRAAGEITPHAVVFWIPYRASWLDASWDCALGVLEWSAGAVRALGVVPVTDGVSVAGDVVALAGGSHAFGVDPSYRLLLRDLAAGVDTSFAPSVAVAHGLDVAANGDVVYSDGRDVLRYRAGATSWITAPGATSCEIFPRTDGDGIVYWRITGGCAGSPSEVVLSRGGVETTLASTDSSHGRPSFPPYFIRDGWVAYGKPDQAGASQVWRLGPSGAEQVTYFSGSSTLVAMGDGGDVVFEVGPGRYLSRPGVAQVEVGSTLGRPVVREGRLLVLVGPHVLELVP